jgi:hypothetical protein
MCGREEVPIYISLNPRIYQKKGAETKFQMRSSILRRLKIFFFSKQSKLTLVARLPPLPPSRSGDSFPCVQEAGAKSLPTSIY